MTEARTVWKDLGSRRARVSDDVKGHGFLMVCTCTAEIKGMMSGYM